MIQVAIVEDDSACAQQMQDNLQRYAREYGEQISSRVYRSGQQIVFDTEGSYDIILMDVEMPGMDGITTAKKIRERDEDVVILFVTNMAQYAIEGYQVKARAYILKPVNYYSFALELQSAIQEARKKRMKALLLSTSDGLVKVRIGQITYIESQKHDLLIHTLTKTIRIREAMRLMEEKLEGCYFERCNVSYLVNLAQVEGIQGDDVLVGQERLPLSRHKRKAFLAALTAFIGGSQNA